MRTDPERVTREQIESVSHSQPGDFLLAGRKWSLLAGVFSPAAFPSTAIFDSLIPYPVGGAFLEMGCGAGVIAVSAALARCARVTAADVNPAAVSNARLNAMRHGVGDIEVVHSDLFNDLPAGSLFDVIFWNSNFVRVADDYDYESCYARAFFDPGYRTHRRFLTDAVRHLTVTGRLLLGFSDLGDRESLAAMAAEQRLLISSLGGVVSEETPPVRYELLELCRDGTGHASTM